MSDTELLSVPEAAKDLGRSRTTLYRWIAAKRVPFHVMSTGEIKLTRAHVQQIRRNMQPRPVIEFNPAQRPR